MNEYQWVMHRLTVYQLHVQDPTTAPNGLHIVRIVTLSVRFFFFGGGGGVIITIILEHW
jgi:hypothetical protein